MGIAAMTWRRAVRFGPLATLVLLLTMSAEAAQVPELKSVMQEKLRHAQQMLGAVVASDWSALERHSGELERLTRDVRWLSLDYPESARQAAAFKVAVRDLRLAANRRDADEAMSAYMRFTAACLGCHRSIARERLTRTHH
jgi:hypothetical protein